MHTDDLDLAPPLPDRYRYVHGFDPRNPRHAAALEGIRLRRVLEVAESRLLAHHRGVRRLGAESVGYLRGLSVAITHSARSLSREDAWREGIGLEVRDLLWQEGYTLPPRSTWSEAPGILAAYTETIPENGSAAWLLEAPLDPSEVLAWPRILGRRTAVRLTGEKPRAWTGAEDEQGVARPGCLLPSGSPILALRRASAVAFAEEAECSAAQWESDFSPERFASVMHQQTLADPSLWTP